MSVPWAQMQLALGIGCGEPICILSMSLLDVPGLCCWAPEMESACSQHRREVKAAEMQLCSRPWGGAGGHLPGLEVPSWSISLQSLDQGSLRCLLGVTIVFELPSSCLSPQSRQSDREEAVTSFSYLLSRCEFCGLEGASSSGGVRRPHEGWGQGDLE